MSEISRVVTPCFFHRQKSDVVGVEVSRGFSTGRVQVALIIAVMARGRLAFMGPERQINDRMYLEHPIILRVSDSENGSANGSAKGRFTRYSTDFYEL